MSIKHNYFTKETIGIAHYFYIVFDHVNLFSNFKIFRFSELTHRRMGRQSHTNSIFSRNLGHTVYEYNNDPMTFKFEYFT